MRTFFTELRHAGRLLRKTPGVSLVAILTLAVGIGANVAIFSVVSGVLLTPPPFRQPDRLLLLWESTPKFPEMSVSYLDFVDWQKGQRSFTGIAASRQQPYTLTGLGEPERLPASMSSANFFDVLGVAPILGRTFAAGEDQPGAAPVALVSYRFWQERLHGDAAAVGRQLTLDGRAFTVIGVLPARFRYHEDYGVFITLAQLDPVVRQQRGMHPGMYGVARLRDGVTIGQARADMETLARGMDQDSGPGVIALPAMAPLAHEETKDIQATLWLLLGAVSFVLLIACANVANLMLARGTARSRELAVRAALGASRWALMRPLLFESAIIAVLGNAVGVLLAWWGVDLLSVLRPDSLPHTAELRIDATVLGYSMVLTTVTALLCGLVPARAASRTDVHESLKAAGARGVAGVAHGRLRAALVVAEVAMALVLLVGAGLSIRTFDHVAHIDPGFRADGLVSMSVALSPRRYPDGPAMRAAITELRRRVAALPGADSAAVSDAMPFYSASEQSFYVNDDMTEQRYAVTFFATPDYLRTVGATLLAGREIAPEDDDKHPPVCLVDADLARKAFPHGDAVGHVLNMNRQKVQVIGVVQPILTYGLEGQVPARYQLYMPIAQLPDRILPLVRGVRVLVRGARPAALVGPARAAIGAFDPEMPISDVGTMNEQIARSIGARRFSMLLLGVFAGVALLLALVGLYAVMSYMVTQRNHEIGVRMALGARARDVERMIVRQGLVLVGLGLAIGLGASLALARVMAALVNGLSSTDPVTYGVVALLLTVAAAAASLVPARAATRVDPMVVLRYE